MERYLELSELVKEMFAKACFRRMKAPFEFRITCEDTKIGKLFYLHYADERFGGYGDPFQLLEEFCERIVLKSKGIDYE